MMTDTAARMERLTLLKRRGTPVALTEVNAIGLVRTSGRETSVVGLFALPDRRPERALKKAMQRPRDGRRPAVRGGTLSPTKVTSLRRQQAFPYVHDFARVLEIAREAGVAVPAEPVDVDLLTDYATLARYRRFAEIGEHDRGASVEIQSITSSETDC